VTACLAAWVLLLLLQSTQQGARGDDRLAWAAFGCGRSVQHLWLRHITGYNAGCFTKSLLNGEWWMVPPCLLLLCAACMWWVAAMCVVIVQYMHYIQ
jgi:hypothetical protein